MDIQLAAIHEAGHSVMQWFVAWVPGEMFLIIDGRNATTAKSTCPHQTFETMSALRKRLLVLFAGRIATQGNWPESTNDYDDWVDARKALNAHFQRPNGLNWNVSDGFSVRDSEADALVDVTRAKCAEIISHPRIRATVDKVGSLLAEVAPDANGRVSLSGKDIVGICEAEIGVEFQQTHPWCKRTPAPCRSSC